MIRKRGKKAPGFPLTWACEWSFWCPSVLSNTYCSLSHLPNPWVPTSLFRWKFLIKKLSSTQKEKKKKADARTRKGQIQVFLSGLTLLVLVLSPWQWEPSVYPLPVTQFNEHFVPYTGLDQASSSVHQVYSPEAVKWHLPGQLPTLKCHLITKSCPCYFDVCIKSPSVTSTTGEGKIL